MICKPIFLKFLLILKKIPPYITVFIGKYYAKTKGNIKMSVEQLKKETGCIVDKMCAKLNLCGQDLTINLPFILVSSALIIMHCMIVKHFCNCKRKLKQKIKEMKEEEE